ncbi:phage repressor protein [Pantoea sp.]|uniref:phage repressor protein n=1 Tax=Pantoea sp. TaxID=69393 RepID=UPI0031D9293A
MGFQSPAQDYIEPRLNLNKIFMPHPANTFRVDTATGFVLVDSVLRVEPGDTVAVQWNGYPMLGKFYGKSLITEDGDALEGEALQDVILLGKVTCEIINVYDSYRPTI